MSELHYVLDSSESLLASSVYSLIVDAAALLLTPFKQRTYNIKHIIFIHVDYNLNFCEKKKIVLYTVIQIVSW